MSGTIGLSSQPLPGRVRPLCRTVEALHEYLRTLLLIVVPAPA
ncbi:hypothetical protein [Arthrobacter sp. SX1312]|nr:hypothetical protein [Arthrobacter sp. SX1312]